jgi:RNA polymerase sigma-70 factor (ECF subfamily)
MDENELAERLATDLDGTFEALVRGQADRLYGIALRLTGDAADAEEVAQDALVRAYRALAGYEPDRIRALRLRPWLAAIAVNLARNRRRRAADRSPALRLVELDGGPPAPIVDHPEATALRRAEVERWAAALACLPDRYRVPLVLRHVDDLSYEEMAEALGRPEGTLRAQVHRGLALLRAAWDAADREELPA